MVDRRLHEQEHDLRPHPEHDQSPVVHLMYGSGGGGVSFTSLSLPCNVDPRTYRSFVEKFARKCR